MAQNHLSEIEYKALDITLLKRLLVFMKPYNKLLIIALIIAVITSALGPIRPYITKIAIDDYIAQSNWQGLINIIVLYFLLLVLHGVLQFSLTYLMQWLGQNVLYDIRIKLFNHIQKLELRFFDNNPVGRLVTRVTNDVESLNELFSSGVIMIIADFLLILWIIGFMFYTDWWLTVITFTILPFLLVATWLFRMRVREVFRQVRIYLAQINTFLNEFITGISTVKIFNQEKEQKEKFEGSNKLYRDSMLKTVLYHAIFFPVIELLSIVVLSIVLWYSAANILSGVMTVGILIAFTQYAEMFFRPIRDLTEKYSILQSSMASSERIFALLDNDSFIKERPNTKELKEFNNAIEFKNLFFSYDNQKAVLEDISFCINKGERVAIVGATGSGKTTIISLLLRFYDYQKGKILIDGKDIKDYKVSSIRSKIALVMQEVFLFSRTISENISLGKPEISEDKIKEAAIALAANNFIEQLPDSYNNHLIERANTLSAGQKQLLAFCRAFAANPEILILDEATSNIDSETEKIIVNSLNILLKQRTSIIIAHRLSTIVNSDKIIVLHKGKIREIGNHNQLIAQKGIYAKLYQLQYQKS